MESEETTPPALFEEVQQPPWPFMALGLGGSALGGLAAGYSLSWWGRLGAAGLVAAGAGLALRELVFPLHTTVLPEEIQVRFGRRTRFRIPLKFVVRAYPRTYDPLREFGGWGIRFGAGGRAFNMRGNQGVQLVLRSGQRVLVGSERAEELAEVIHEITGCSTEPDEPEVRQERQGPRTEDDSFL